MTIREERDTGPGPSERDALAPTRVVEQSLEPARAAFARHAWAEARRLFAEADAAAALAPGDLESYADATWWSGRPDLAVGIRERAYAGYVERKDRSSVSAFTHMTRAPVTDMTHPASSRPL